MKGYHVPEDEFEGILSGDDDDSDLNETEPLNETQSPPGKRKKEIPTSNQKKKRKLDMTNEEESEDSDASELSEGLHLILLKN